MARRVLQILFAGFRRRIALALLLCGPSLAVAAIVDNGEYITDTESGLDWRDVRLSRGQSYDDVNLLLAPGGPLEGWRYATPAEFNVLMQHFGVPYVSGLCSPDYCDYMTTEEPAVTEAILSLGDTGAEYLANEGPDLYATAWSADPQGAHETLGILGQLSGQTVQTALVYDRDLIYTSSGASYPCTSSWPCVDKVLTSYRGGNEIRRKWLGTAFYHYERNPQVGSFLVRDTTFTLPENCSNGIDDDGDSLVDDDDPDCAPAPEPVGLQVQCMHEPIYPQAGDEVTISARAIDRDGNVVSPDRAEIYINDQTSPAITEYAQAAFATYTANDGFFGYGCLVTKGAETAFSWAPHDPRLRSVDTGRSEGLRRHAIPVLYNGSSDEKVDIVLFHDDDEYSSYLDPNFLDDVHTLVEEGLWTIPWFVEHQWLFNIWIGEASTANASPKDTSDSNARCNRDLPLKVHLDTLFRDAGGIVHRSACRDNAGSPRTFTVEMQWNRLQVIAHEMGHRPFGLADEYAPPTAASPGGYFRNGPFPNLFQTEDGCRGDADVRAYEADACRSFTSTRFSGDTWWIGEPDYRENPPYPTGTAPRDLMQQTGWLDSGQVNARGQTIWIDRSKVGKSEVDRMTWFVSKCLDGEC